MLLSLKLTEKFISLPKKIVERKAFNTVGKKEDFDTELLAPLLTKQGFEVEAIVYRGRDLEGVIVGQIIECVRHPNAEKLSLCKVNVGSKDPLQIVCGAPNARTDLFVAVATIGTTLPGDKKIMATTIRDVPSEGMLCAREELGLSFDEARDGKGIWELESDVQGGVARSKLEKCLGQPLFEVLDLDDVLFELNVTPNRPDMQCHLGAARELAAGFQHSGVSFNWKNYTLAQELSALKIFQDALKYRSVTLNGRELSAENFLGTPAFFVGLENIEVKHSPGWLRNLLETLGQNSVNAIVDASNFILLALGQPSHAFDVDKLATVHGKTKLELRFAREGERFLGLDGKERELKSTDTVVADAHGPQALLGVIGGADSKVDFNTKNILLEIANPNAVCVRRTSRRIGRITDASFAFEKGIDTSARWQATAELIGFFTELMGGKAPRYQGTFASVLKERDALAQEFISNSELEAMCGPLLKEGACIDATLAIDCAEARLTQDLKHFAEKKRDALRVHFSPSHQQQVLGCSLLDFPAQLEILKSLGFEEEKNDATSVKLLTPHWRRHDVDGFADLIEEVVRVIGIDQVPSTPLGHQGSASKDDAPVPFMEALAKKAAALGYVEVIDFHFMREDDLPRLGLAPHALGNTIELMNPIIADEPLMHTTLIPDLLRKVEHNLNYGTSRGQIFHLTRTFQNLTENGELFFESESKAARVGYEYAPQLALKYTAEENAKPRPSETPRLAGVVFGHQEEKEWYTSGIRGWSLHTVMAHVMELSFVAKAQAEILPLPDDHPMASALHPGRRAHVVVCDEKGNKTSLGWVGVVHPRVLRAYSIDSPTVIAFELNAAVLLRYSLSQQSVARKAMQPHRFPMVSRDFAFLLDDSTGAAQLLETVKSACLPLLKTKVPAALGEVKIFDIYRGQGVPEHKKSVAFRVHFQPTERTLTENDIQAVTQAVVTGVTSSLKGELRG